MFKRTGLVKPVAFGLITAGSAVAVAPAIEWMKVSSPIKAHSVRHEQPEPQHAPATAITTVYTVLTSTGVLSTGDSMYKVGQLFAWQAAYAVNEPLPGAVTIPAGERIGFIRGAADAVPTEVFKLA